MKTRCMVDGTELDHQDCLKCSLNPEHGCDYNYELLKAIFDDAEHERHPGYHVSDIKGCLKRAWFNRTHEAPTDIPSNRMALTTGTVMHAALAGRGTDENVIAEQLMQVDYDVLTLVGTFDAYYPAHKVLSDTKTTRWLKQGNLPYGDHVIQVQIYANMMRHLGYEVDSAEIQYIDLSGPSKCRKCARTLLPYSDNELQCPKCRTLFDRNKEHLGALRYEVDISDTGSMDGWISARLWELDESIKDNTPPQASPSVLCNYCPFSQICEESAA